MLVRIPQVLNAEQLAMLREQQRRSRREHAKVKVAAIELHRVTIEPGSRARSTVTSARRDLIITRCQRLMTDRTDAS